MKLTKEEKETVIVYDMENSEAIVYTYDPKIKRKLSEISKKAPDQVQCISKDSKYGDVEYSIPKTLISIRTPRAKKELTKEERKAIGERLAATRE